MAKIYLQRKDLIRRDSILLVNKNNNEKDTNLRKSMFGFSQKLKNQIKHLLIYLKKDYK